MSARHKRIRWHDPLDPPPVCCPALGQRLSIGEMQLTEGRTLKVSLVVREQGPRIAVKKYSKTGKELGGVSIAADTGRALASMIEAAANVAGQREGQTDSPPPWI